LYIYLFVKEQEHPYYLTRARVKVIEEIDFESV
jgi:hypothetical protein